MNENGPVSLLVGERLKHAVDMARGSRAALDREAEGLVEDHHVAILEQHHRADLVSVARIGALDGRRFLRGELERRHAHAFAGREPGRNVRPLARDAHLALAHDPHQVRIRDVRKPAVKPAVEPHARFVLADLVRGHLVGRSGQRLRLCILAHGPPHSAAATGRIGPPDHAATRRSGLEGTPRKRARSAVALAGAQMQDIGSFWLYPIILVAGALQAWGPPMNGALRNALTNPWLASIVSFVPIVALLAVLWFCQPRPLPTAGGLENMPWWAPLGGVIGAFAVIAGPAVRRKSRRGRFCGAHDNREHPDVARDRPFRMVRRLPAFPIFRARHRRRADGRRDRRHLEVLALSPMLNDGEPVRPVRLRSKTKRNYAPWRIITRSSGSTTNRLAFSTSTSKRRTRQWSRITSCATFIRARQAHRGQDRGEQAVLRGCRQGDRRRRRHPHRRPGAGEGLFRQIPRPRSIPRSAPMSRAWRKRTIRATASSSTSRAAMSKPPTT